MKKILTFYLLLMGIWVVKASAESKVRVEVNNEVNSQSYSNSETNSTTDIKIKVNGEEKVIHADGDEDVEWESASKEAKVSMKNEVKNESMGATVSATPSLVLSPTLSPGDTTRPEEVPTTESTNQLSDFFKKLWERILNWF